MTEEVLPQMTEGPRQPAFTLRHGAVATSILLLMAGGHVLIAGDLSAAMVAFFGPFASMIDWQVGGLRLDLVWWPLVGLLLLQLAGVLVFQVHCARRRADTFLPLLAWGAFWVSWCASGYLAVLFAVG